MPNYLPKKYLKKLNFKLNFLILLIVIVCCIAAITVLVYYPPSGYRGSEAATSYTLESASIYTADLTALEMGTPDLLKLTFDSLPSPTATCAAEQEFDCYYGFAGQPEFVGTSGLTVYDADEDTITLTYIARADLFNAAIGGIMSGLTSNDILVVAMNFNTDELIDFTNNDTFDIALENFLGDSSLAGAGYDVGCSDGCEPESLFVGIESAVLETINIDGSDISALKLTFNALPAPAATCNLGEGDFSCYYGLNQEQGWVGNSGFSFFDSNSSPRTVLFILRGDHATTLLANLGVQISGLTTRDAIVLGFDLDVGEPVSMESDDTFNIASSNFTGYSGIEGNAYEVGCDGDCEASADPTTELTAASALPVNFGDSEIVT